MRLQKDLAWVFYGVMNGSWELLSFLGKVAPFSHSPNRIKLPSERNCEHHLFSNSIWESWNCWTRSETLPNLTDVALIQLWGFDVDQFVTGKGTVSIVSVKHKWVSFEACLCWCEKGHVKIQLSTSYHLYEHCGLVSTHFLSYVPWTWHHILSTYFL